jgi:hypothetical protein
MMAGVTENYGFAVEVATDDFIEPDHHNRMAATLDRVLGNFLKKMMADGAFSGWGLTTQGKVTAGEGLIGGCWCQTAEEQAISGLTAAATNYVFARPTSEGPTTGAVSFFAQVSGTKPAGAILLGTVEVDGDGQVTAVHEDLPEVDRNCLKLEIGQLCGSGLVTAVVAGADFTAQVQHGEVFIVPGAIVFNSSSGGFTWELRETYRGDGFVIKGHNGGTSEADFAYTWARRGLIG